MEYRLATLEDFPAFETMLRACLVEEEMAGGQVLATRKTLDHYREMARHYLSGRLFGILILAEDPGPIGFVLTGEDAGSKVVDTPTGKVAYVWQAWVDPTHRKSGVGIGMLVWGRPMLVEMGFQTAVMSVLESNPEGQALTLSFGAKAVDRVYHFPLKEEPRERATLQPD